MPKNTKNNATPGAWTVYDMYTACGIPGYAVCKQADPLRSRGQHDPMENRSRLPIVAYNTAVVPYSCFANAVSNKLSLSWPATTKKTTSHAPPRGSSMKSAKQHNTRHHVEARWILRIYVTEQRNKKSFFVLFFTLFNIYFYLVLLYTPGVRVSGSRKCPNSIGFCE